MNSTSARLLGELGAALLDSGLSVTDVRTHLDRATARHHLGPLVFSVLPAHIMATEPASGATIVVPSLGTQMTYAQAAAVNRLARRVELGLATIDEIPERVAAIRKLTPRFLFLKWMVGATIVPLGLAVLFRCPWWAVLLSAAVGALFGLLSWVLERLRGANAIAPFVISFGTTLAVGLTANALHVDAVPLFAVCAPVAILVPGTTITNALLELTSTDIVTGSSRLMYGLITLAFMAAGIAAAAVLTGLQIDPGSVALVGHAGNATALGSGWQAIPEPWHAWLAVVILAIGAGLTFGTSDSFIWMNIVMMAGAYALLTSLVPVVGNVTATGLTAGLLFFIVRQVERFTLAVPAAVAFQPAFLLLVPGTVGLVAVATFTQEALVAALLTFASLCIGIKIGAVTSDLTIRQPKLDAPHH